LRMRDVLSWLIPGASVCVVLLSAGYGFSKKGIAAEHIRDLSEVGTRLTEAADLVQLGAVRPDQALQIESQLKDLEQRMGESTKPGMVQGELVASARKAGLDLREVFPIAAMSGSPVKGIVSYPSYRVMVEGSYQQISEFLQACQSQRVPARATSFRIGPAVDEQGKPRAGLKADMVMESFVPNANIRPSTVGAK
jgi:Tfp pilus assembly protein PilO